MSASEQSASWYRVRGLAPSLRSHVRVHRHVYRGRTWYVMQDLTTERFLRLTPATYAVIGLMDGRRTVEEIQSAAGEQLVEEAPGQDEILQLLSQLHRHDLLQTDVAPAVGEALARYQERRRRAVQSKLLSPFAIKLPLLDPDRFLDRALPLVRPLIGSLGLVLWLCVVSSGAVVAGLHWQELTDGILDHVFAAENALLLWILFPLMKALHEFGHGFVIKRYGGEVHEMGVIFLVLTPVPYVDASAASAFRSRRQRVAVGAAGIVVELFLAGLALLLWANVEPGLVRSLAYNAALIGTVASLAFNLNPLLRFDGYYIASDWLEIPNLRARANAYVKFLFERYLFGLPEAEPPDASSGERAWFVGFSVSAFAYRIVILFAIGLFVLEQSFFIGLLLLGVSAIGWFVLPLVRGLSALAIGPRLRNVRGRAIAATAVLAAGVVGLLGVVPVPLRTLTEGVVWMPEEAIVRTGTDGYVDRIAAAPGSLVEAGQVLFELRDEQLESDLLVTVAKLRELETRYARLMPVDRSRASIELEELELERERLEQLRSRESELVVRAATSGTFIVPRNQDLPGRFLPKGVLMAYVVDLDALVVRAVVDEDRIDLVRVRTSRAYVRLDEALERVVEARVWRVAPGAAEHLPSSALGSVGGGPVATDPRDETGLTPMAPVFEVELELSAPARMLHMGGRAHVRFDHGSEPLAVQGWRALRQLFLERLSV